MTKPKARSLLLSVANECSLIVHLIPFVLLNRLQMFVVQHENIENEKIRILTGH